MPIREQQTTNKQHAIPQSIMSVEFKIIGDLTLKQFFFLLIFIGLAYASFMLIPVVIIKWVMVLFFGAAGLAFAFLPLGDRGLDAWIVNFLRAMFMPNQYVYRKDENIPDVFLYQNLDVLKSELITLTPTSSRRKIEAYLEQQEAPVDKLDIDEKSYILKVKDAYNQPGYWPAPAFSGSMSTASVTTTVVEDMQEVIPVAIVTDQATSATSTAMQVQPEQPQTQTQPEQLQVQPAVIQIQTPQVTQVPQSQPPIVQTQAPQPTQIQAPESQIQVQAPSPKVIQPQQKEPQPMVEDTTQIIRQETRRADYKREYTKRQDDGFYSPAMTPDMHAGRRFINLAEDAGRGEIVLPIRGERVLKTLQEQEFEESEKQKIKELDDLINTVKSKELMQKQIIDAQKLQQREDEVKREREEQVRAEQERLRQANDQSNQQAEQNAQRAKAQAEAVRQRELEEKRRKEQEEAQTVAKEQARLAELRQKEEVLRKQKADLLKKQQEEAQRQKAEAEKQAQTPQPVKPQPIPLQAALVDEAPTVPNIVWGLVTTNYQGAKVGVPGVVVVIRNQKGEVVRAIKTSQQGRFGISTPLVNGSYTLEVDKEKRSGLTFALMQVEAKGQTIPTVEIEGEP